jgi:hypothetical protein
VRLFHLDIYIYKLCLTPICCALHSDLDDDDDDDDEEEEDAEEDEEEQAAKWEEVTTENDTFSGFWQRTMKEGVAWFDATPGYKSERWGAWAK